MNVRLSYSTDFVAINVLENRVYPNIYKVDIELITISDDGDTQNIAFEKMKFLLGEIFEGSILINSTHPLLKTFLSVNPTKVIMLPESPFDQVVGMALYQKINAIMDDYLVIHEIKVSSRAGANIGYVVDEQDDFGEFEKPTKIEPWWFRDDLQTIDTKQPIQQLSWADLDLEWPDEDGDILELIPEEESSEISDIEPKKKSKKKIITIEIIDVFNLEEEHKFNPTIIDGGLSPDANKQV